MSFRHENLSTSLDINFGRCHYFVSQETEKEPDLGARKISRMNFRNIVTMPKIFVQNRLDGGLGRKDRPWYRMISKDYAKYTTNKGLLPDMLIQKMRGAYARSEEFLDLEIQDVKKIQRVSETASNDLMKSAIQSVTPQDLERMQ